MSFLSAYRLIVDSSWSNVRDMKGCDGPLWLRFDLWTFGEELSYGICRMRTRTYRSMAGHNEIPD
jgi:hypothetical protein